VEDSLTDHTRRHQNLMTELLPQGRRLVTLSVYGGYNSQAPGQAVGIDDRQTKVTGLTGTVTGDGAQRKFDRGG
jgi:hypothetical protein